MKMRDVEHAAGLFMNGLAAAFYSVRLSGFLLFSEQRSINGETALKLIKRFADILK